MSSGVQMYHVPIILPDLRREESLTQVIDSLEYLQAVANDIFNRISNRVAENRDQLTAINNRINTCQAKVDKLRHRSKATQVYATPKYPAPRNLNEYTSLFSNVNPQLQKIKRSKVSSDIRLPDVTNEMMIAKTAYFKPRLATKASVRKNMQKAADNDENSEAQGEGLGSLPKHLPSVSSLLLFNTAENPYKKYVILDPLEGVKTKTRDTIKEEEISEAPYTITEGEELLHGNVDSVMYVPIMPELPELDVPLQLPHLPNVADDLFYEADLGPSIAPSVAGSNVPELPTLEIGETQLPPAPSLAMDFDLSGAPPPPPPPTSAAEPPPPPPPPPPVGVPAPPPPPPPPADNDDDDDVPPTDNVSAADDGRANLMAAIRKAGGTEKAGLKSAKERKRRRKAKKEEEDAVPAASGGGGGGDLLGDLHAALSRRRKGISGRQDKDDLPNTGGGTIMDRVASMIPPPMAGGGGRTEATDDGDNDWEKSTSVP